MSDPLRISANKARQRTLSGKALLVCAYDDADKFRQNHLEGALSYPELLSKLPALDKGHEIIFYCA